MNSFLPNITNNPVILRETTSRLRSMSSFIYLGGLLFIGFVYILFNWQYIQIKVSDIYFNPLQIRELFQFFNISLLLGICCIVPFISANAITNEKERETWDLLATTPITMPSIVFGKLISSLFFIWILLISMLPFYGIFFLFGTVQFQEVLFTFAIATELSIVISLIGIYCSCLWKRTIQSVSATYLFGFFYVGGFALLGMIFYGLLFNSRDSGLEYLLSPLVIFYTYFEGPNPLINYLDVNTQYNIHIIENIVLVFLLIWMTFRTLYNPIEPKPRKIFTDQRLNLNSKSVEEWFKRFTPVHNIPDGSNPVDIKEFRALFHKRWMWVSMIGLVLASFAIFAFAMMRPVILQPNEMLRILVFPLMFSPLLIIPYSANAIRSEYDRDTMDLLLTTEIRAEEIITGKIRAGFRFFFLRFTAFGTLLLLSAMGTAFFNSFYQFNYFSDLAITFSTAYFIISLSILISLVSTNSVMSYALTGLCVAFLYFSNFILGMIVSSLFGINRQLIHSFSQLSPYLMNPQPLRVRDDYDYIYHMSEGAFIFQSIWLIAGSFICYWLAVRIMERRIKN